MMLATILRECNPVFLLAFAGNMHPNLASNEGRAVLAIAPTQFNAPIPQAPYPISDTSSPGRAKGLYST